MNSEKSKKSTFAGNIGEMIYESFFLKSAIGEFAEEKITNSIEDKNTENSKMYLNNIADPVTKSLIKTME